MAENEKLSRPTGNLYEQFKPSVNNVIYAKPHSGGSSYVTLDSISADPNQNFNLDSPNNENLTRAGSSGTRSGVITSDEIARTGPVHPPKIRQHSYPRNPNKNQQRFTPQGRLCPFCKAPTSTECGCQMCISTCENGHRFYYDPVSGQPIPLNFSFQNGQMANLPGPNPNEPRRVQQMSQQTYVENEGRRRARERETRVTPVVQ